MGIRPAVEVSEISKSDGIYAVIKITPSNNFFCRIAPHIKIEDRKAVYGGYRRTTRANGKGSIRYSWHANYTEALEAGLAWANRKAREIEKETA